MNNKHIINLRKYDEVFFQADLDRSQHLELSEFLSFRAKDYKFHPMYRANRWSGFIYFLDKQNRFPIGLYSKFCEFCDKYNYDHYLDISKGSFGENISEEGLNKFLEIIFPQELNLFPYDHQIEAVLKAIQYGRGILNLATSAGKSLIIYCLLRYLIAKNKKVIVIVPSVSLVEQLFSDFKNDYGWQKANDNICLNYSGKGVDNTKSILVTTWQSVYKNHQSFFERYDGLIVDEAHSMQGKSLSEIGKKCINAKYRWGTTGTLPENEADANTVIGYVGPVIHKVMSKELIDKGIISKIKIRNLILNYPQHMRVARSSYQREVDDINSYENRNLALDYIIKNAKDDENILILVTKIEHLISVKLYIEQKFKKRKVHEIYGKTEADVREEIRKGIEKESGSILVASYGTFSTGVSVKKLHHIVLFSSYKSQIKILQSIGRGLRKHESKEFVTIWDCIDQLIYSDGRKNYKNWTYKHWEGNRLRYYDEQEFEYTNETINI